MNRRIQLTVLIILSGVLVALSGYALATVDRPAPVAVVAAAVPVSSPAAAPKRDAVGYLAALRTANVPVSVAGGSEVAIARGVCAQLADGTSRGKLVSDLNAMYAPLAGVDGYYDAVAVVDAAQANYC